MMDPKHYRLEYVRRRIRQQLYAVQLGLTGGDDHPPPKERAPGAPQPTSPTNPTTAAAADKKELRGVFAVAKNQAEKDEVDKVYHRVRKLVEAIEAGSDSDIHQLVKDVRNQMKHLEAITKRLPPPGAATGVAAAGGEDVPSMPAKGKATPAKSPAVPSPARGKATSTPPRPAPNVFGLPRNR